MEKRGKDLEKLQSLVKRLLTGKPLAPHHRKHRLKGGLARCLKCHIEPGWLLAWEEDALSVSLARTGTHADLI